MSNKKGNIIVPGCKVFTGVYLLDSGVWSKVKGIGLFLNPDQINLLMLDNVGSDISGRGVTFLNFICNHQMRINVGASSFLVLPEQEKRSIEQIKQFCQVVRDKYGNSQFCSALLRPDNPLNC